MNVFLAASFYPRLFFISNLKACHVSKVCEEIISTSLLVRYTDKDILRRKVGLGGKMKEKKRKEINHGERER